MRRMFAVILAVMVSVGPSVSLADDADDAARGIVEEGTHAADEAPGAAGAASAAVLEHFGNEAQQEIDSNSGGGGDAGEANGDGSN